MDLSTPSRGMCVSECLLCMSGTMHTCTEMNCALSNDRWSDRATYVRAGGMFNPALWPISFSFVSLCLQLGCICAYVTHPVSISSRWVSLPFRLSFFLSLPGMTLVLTLCVSLCPSLSLIQPFFLHLPLSLCRPSFQVITSLQHTMHILALLISLPSH